MIRPEEALESLRRANAVPRLDELDADELAAVTALLNERRSAMATGINEGSPRMSPPARRRRPILAFAAALVVVAVVVGLVILLPTTGDDVVSPRTTTAVPTTAAAVPDTAAPARPPVSLVPVEGLDPVRISTSIGEIEFTTFVPGGEVPPWPMITTAHGIVGSFPPEGKLGWSLDGITWMEIPIPAPSGWSDKSPVFADDVIVWEGGNAVGRATWDGARWANVEILPDTRIDGAEVTLVGPRGIVFVRGDRIYYWDGTEFTPAARPPNPSLHPESSPGCEGQDLAWGPIQLGPVVATDQGFLALAARNDSLPVCEPLAWFSPDGNVWVPTTDESPFGESAVVRDLAIAGGRIVAVGGMSYWDTAVWVSDDGIAWQRTDLDGAHILRVAGGTRGWIAVGHGDMWFSPDGLVWDGPYQRPPGWEDSWGFVGVAMLDDRIIGGELVVGVFVDE